MAADSPDQLAWALKALRDNTRQYSYRETTSFYETGKPSSGHLERLGSRKFREVFGAVFDLSDNLCSAVVDSVADRLKIIDVEPGEEADAALAEKAWGIWQRNRMDVRAPETHHEALMNGDGYALVWPDGVTGEAVIWSIPACDMAVTYDANRPGVISRAARVWFDEEDERTHIDLYLSDPDRVERYASKAKRKQGSAAGNVNHFEPYIGINSGGVEIESVQEHQWGMPIVHFPNLRFHGYGVSELSNVLPLQRALNKTLIDLMVAQEFSAFRQRWATGIDDGDGGEDPSGTPAEGKPAGPPFAHGVDTMFVSQNELAKFGSFDATDITQYVQVLENHRAEIARVSGTPLHYLFITKGDFPSGEAMKSAEARFTAKVEKRQSSFGNRWEDVLAVALRIEGVDDAKGSMLSLKWDPASAVPLPAGASAAQPGVAPEQSTTPA